MATKVRINGELDVNGVNVKNESGWLKVENIDCTQSKFGGIVVKNDSGWLKTDNFKCDKFEVGGRNFFIAGTEPPTKKRGDVWIETAGI